MVVLILLTSCLLVKVDYSLLGLIDTFSFLVRLFRTASCFFFLTILYRLPILLSARKLVSLCVTNQIFYIIEQECFGYFLNICLRVWTRKG